MEIDDLPDEILLIILGLVRDGVTLLDGASLVSKRWRRLGFEPCVWAGVWLDIGAHRDPSDPSKELDDEYECSGGIQRHITDAARVILHAPALAGVAMPDPLAFCEHEELVFSALRRTAAKVRALTRVSFPGHGWVSNTLRALGPHLHELQMLGSIPGDTELLKRMTVLKRLHFTGRIGGGFSYSEDLQLELPQSLEDVQLIDANRSEALGVHRLPRLRRFVLDCSDPKADFPAAPVGSGLLWLRVQTHNGSGITLRSLVHAHAATLLELEVACGSMHLSPNDVDDLADTLAAGTALRRVVLLRRHVLDLAMNPGTTRTLSHDEASCRAQVEAVRDRLGRQFGEANAAVVLCSLCG